VLLALTGYESALVVVAACFIVFALVAALVIPRTRPSFPGNGLGIFLAICGVFFVAQMTAVLVLAEVGEADEPVAEETAGSESEPTETTGTETTGTETTPPQQAEGDPAAGKEIFVGSAGCGGCHTLADAQTTGQVGPNLDQLKPSYDAAVAQVTNGGGGMPPFKDTLTEQQIKDVSAYVSTATQG
jgi:mono/diheme cytochrome c family protein